MTQHSVSFDLAGIRITIFKALYEVFFNIFPYFSIFFLFYIFPCQAYFSFVIHNDLRLKVETGGGEIRGKCMIFHEREIERERKKMRKRG